ncbi:MAG: hypothetical protein KKF46_02230, partial [Nanoarchaeota archaeon]|nr:hypothetical protein [Nanoarchaeota archaeon]MBU1321152.1 hypothetical protein [Nanoarchaeota archaeon]MBU1597481.1 hypothetical protein [Nanoarchaeota archaeon]MBU2441855.1 hypothetical protein [Nanoarchaeota archaeon]
MRKGQAALEFLTTYGWAFLVILIMIGALAYFGVLNPSGLLPARCTFSPEISCIEHEVDSTGLLKFRFRNNVGSMATFNFSAEEISSGAQGWCINYSNVRAGRIEEVNCTFSTTFPAGDKIKFEVNAFYTKAGGSYDVPVKGEIYGEAK